MNLTIVQFTGGLKLAGQERVVVDLAKAFHQNNHKSMVCTILLEGELVEELKQLKIPFKCFELKRSYDLRGLIPIMRYLKDNRTDVVITHGVSSCWLPRIAAILLQIPALIHVEHNVSDYKEFYKVFMNKILFVFTDKIVCISKNAKKSLLECEKPKADKVLVIHNGLDTNRFAHLDTNHKQNERKKRVGIIGRFQEQKGHIYFLKAAANIVKNFKNVEFIFIGDGPLKPFIMQKANEYDLEKYCHFLGARLDIGELVQTLDVFVLSSLWEGLPITLLEAQYFGIASVVTDVGGNSEIILNEYNGLLVPPKNPEKLATAILRTLKDDKLMFKLGVNAQKVISSRFSINRTVDAYLNLIYSILNEKVNKIIRKVKINANCKSFSRFKQ